MHFYSPRAYQFLRNKFNKHLPSPVTLRKWYSHCTSEGEPGISKESIKSLATLADKFKLQNKQLIVSIAFDEMNIRRMVQWNDSKKKFIGYITHGQFKTENIPVARNALVFLVTGLNSDFSLPIAHYFIIALNAAEKASIIVEVITEISKLGIRIANLVFDGLSSNLSACKTLGASFDLLNIKPSILNPIDLSEIHIFLDPCHMMKLARNFIASEKFIHNRTNNESISWIFFERLEACRIKNNFVCHKLTKKHIQWYRAKMDVRLAAETLSNSVANAMEHLKQEGVKAFQNSDETIAFIRIIDRFFDIFNSKKEKKDIFKSPIKISTKESIFTFLDQAETYVRSLTLARRSVLISKKSTAFKGMLINIKSIKRVVEEYIDTNLMECLPTFRMSQDPLESLFGRIRSLNGNNDNPNVEQFSSALRKLLIHNEIQSSDLSNCRDQLSILTISSFKKKDPQIALNEDNDEDLNSVDILSFRNESFCPNDNVLDVFQDTSTVRMAAEIENKIQFVARFECEECMNVLEENEKISSSFHKYSPCSSTVLIGKVVYKFINLFKNKRNISYNVLLECILKNIKSNTIFPNFACEETHKEYFINYLTQEFIRMHTVYIAKTETLHEQKLMLRKKLTKAIHHRGQ